MKNLLILFSVILFVNCHSQTQQELDDLEKKWSEEFNQYVIKNNQRIVSQVNIDSLETILINKINSLRLDSGLVILTKNGSLSNYADNWSVNMSNKNKLYHSDIENNNIVAENVFSVKSFGSFPMEKKFVLTQANVIFDSWFSSKYHKRNMLLPNINEIGISILFLPNGMIDVYSTMVVN